MRNGQCFAIDTIWSSGLEAWYEKGGIAGMALSRSAKCWTVAEHHPRI